MDYYGDAVMGNAIDDFAMAELLQPLKPAERSGWEAAAPSRERNTCFFVPSMSGDTADALASDEFGA